jgi:hypothetical protein
VIRRALAIALLAAASAGPTRAAAPAIELFGGAAFNARTTLTVRQTGASPLELTARYSTRPLRFPLYYAVRLGSRRAAPCWELQFVHQKLYLENRPPEIESLEITHGFNLLTVNRACAWRGGTVRFGAGCTIPHAEGRVRGRRFASRGYRVAAGPVVLVGAGSRRALGGRFWLSGEIQAAAGWVDIPMSLGRMRAANGALHAWIGLGYAPGPAPKAR